MSHNVQFSPATLAALNSAIAEDGSRWEIMEDVAYLGPQDNPISEVFTSIYEIPGGQFIVVQHGSTQIAVVPNVEDAISWALEYQSQV